MKNLITLVVFYVPLLALNVLMQPFSTFSQIRTAQRQAEKVATLKILEEIKEKVSVSMIHNCEECPDEVYDRCKDPKKKDRNKEANESKEK